MTIPRPLAFRLRVRTPKDDGDLFVATSLRANNPGGNQQYNYVQGPPKFDGLQIDPVTGDVTVGAATIRVIDQFADIAQSLGGEAIPPPPPAPGNLIIGNALLAGTWTLDYAAALLTGTYPPPTGYSFDGWPGPKGYELWNVYHGGIGGTGWFFRHGVFGTPDGLVASTSYVVRALIASFSDFQPRGVYIPAPYGDDTPRSNDSAPPPPIPRGWIDTPALTDGSGGLVINVGWPETIESDANIVYLGALMIFDTTGTPVGGGEPGGTGGDSAAGRGRLVTSYLADLTARMRMLNLKAVLEESTDGGSTW
jgi:hypothetical protein